MKVTVRENKIARQWQDKWEQENPRPIIARFETQGMPDFIVFRDDGFMMMYEMKREKGVLRPRQKVIIPLLRRYGHRVDIVRELPKGV